MKINKKQIAFTMLGMFFLFGMVTAGVIGINSRDVKVESKVSTTINAINAEGIERGDITCKDRECSQKMWKGDYRLGTESVPRYECTRYSEPKDEKEKIVCLSEREFTDAEIKASLSEKQTIRLKNIAEVIDNRTSTNSKEIIDKGEIILTN